MIRSPFCLTIVALGCASSQPGNVDWIDLELLAEQRARCHEQRLVPRDVLSYAGRWLGDFEGATFLPNGDCDYYHSAGADDDLWALVPTHKNGYAISTCLDVVLRGTIEGPGSFGHLGVFEYQFVVHEVLSAERSELSAEECFRSLLDAAQQGAAADVQQLVSIEGLVAFWHQHRCSSGLGGAVGRS